MPTVPQEALGGRSYFVERHAHQVMTRVAKSLVHQSVQVQPDEKVVVIFEFGGLPLVESLEKELSKKGLQSTFFLQDQKTQAEQARLLPPEQIKKVFEEERVVMEESDKIIFVRAPEPLELAEVLTREQQEAWHQGYSQAHIKRLNSEIPYVITYWPTRYEALQDGVSYQDYLKIFLEACDQPWEQIEEAQATLISQLNQGGKLELVANSDDPNPQRRTSIQMSIEEMTFVNSTIKRNFPGSEVFSAPVVNSVNGYMFAEGAYDYRGQVVKNIHLSIVDGRVTEDSYAESGNEKFQSLVSQGPGGRYFGEIGIGTNPGLTRRFLNPLLNEKVGGSFHMAIGHCYNYTDYFGEPVSVNNGNTSDRTSIHWDIAVLMHPQAGGGKIILDGEVIQEDGQFLDPRLAILNPKL